MMTEMGNKYIEQLQDHAVLQSWLLMLMEGLETGKMPKDLLEFNDNCLTERISIIEELLKKQGIDVPE